MWATGCKGRHASTRTVMQGQAPCSAAGRLAVLTSFAEASSGGCGLRDHQAGLQTLLGVPPWCCLREGVCRGRCRL